MTPSGRRKRIVTAPEVTPADGGRRPAGDDLLAEQDGHPVGQCLHLVHVVGRQQDRRALRRQQPDQVPGLAAPGGIEAGRRLVEEQELGVADDPEADVQPALLAAREALDPVVGLLRQPDQLDHLVDRSRVRVVAGVAGQHLAHRVVRLDRQLLEDDADARAQPALRAVVGRVDAERLHPAAAPLPEPLEDLDRRGLAGPVRTEQREHLTLAAPRS